MGALQSLLALAIAYCILKNIALVIPRSMARASMELRRATVKSLKKATKIGIKGSRHARSVLRPSKKVIGSVARAFVRAIFSIGSA